MPGGGESCRRFCGRLLRDSAIDRDRATTQTCSRMWTVIGLVAVVAGVAAAGGLACAQLRLSLPALRQRVRDIDGRRLRQPAGMVARRRLEAAALSAVPTLDAGACDTKAARSRRSNADRRNRRRTSRLHSQHLRRHFVAGRRGAHGDRKRLHPPSQRDHHAPRGLDAGQGPRAGRAVAVRCRVRRAPSATWRARCLPTTSALAAEGRWSNRYGRFVLMSPHDLDVAERWFTKYGYVGYILLACAARACGRSSVCRRASRG